MSEPQAKKPIVGVITGDIVSSSEKDRKILLQDLKEILVEIDKLQPKKTLPFELYRGDSFQGLIVEPEKALKYSLLIRANLKKKSNGGNTDARIAIGVGTVNFMATTAAESDGEAFRNSGPILDTMKDENVRLRVKTPWEEINQELDVSLFLADALIHRWTTAQVEVIAESLMGKKQTEIAEKLKISQSAVNQRLKAGNWEAINKLMVRFNTLITEYTKQP